MFKNQILDIFC